MVILQTFSQHNILLNFTADWILNVQKLKNQDIPDNIKNILSEEEISAILDDPSSINDLAYDLIEIEEFDNAYDLFSFGYSVNGMNCELLNGIAAIYTETGLPQNALKVLKKASSLFPDDSVTLANTATLYWENGLYAKAIYYYNKAIEKNNTLLDAHINLINLYYENGDIYLAFITCLKVLEIFPDDSQIIELRDELIFDMAINCC